MSEPAIAEGSVPPDDTPDDWPMWDVPVPPGGWGIPWPQCVELARALPSTQWTLVGGLMVQLHSAAAGLAVSRPTADVDIVLHIETGAATTMSVAAVLRSLGYELEPSIDASAPAHRFVRGDQQIDVMVADHLAPKMLPTLGGRRPFQVPGGTQALRRTVNCRMTADDDGPVLISIPNALGALVLKGAAYREDSRDKDRHLDDAVVLCATIRNPLITARQMKGSDKSRVLTLHEELSDPGHRSWLLLESADRIPAMDALRILAANHSLPPANRLKRS
ncbi:hypothetical protein E5206_06255 [Arthrobacter sp. PAMC25564]|uniref:hypothetical protein n=1 Tax=Arthrobacter sp. PAMC25564 TaxID=2565366 RepID=UPI0010A27FA3|nr:hypothetical protein [Arthrobacter sp. PAMC25564]QCB96578.1 hypothetical protein E5206_06255 [Arthrobacter sp. PAMC25564]